MPSPLQYAANRLNAAKSSGPSTPKGKVRSSLNALRHGLTARVVVLPTEDLEVYQTFSKEIVDSLDPQTPVERQFAQTVADNQWRINRIRTIEDGMLAEGHFAAIGDFDAEHPGIHSAFTAARAFQAHSQDFVNLSIYEQRLHRSMRDALRQLGELQTRRRERHKAQMDDAIRLHNTEKMKGLPYHPAPDGFVYAPAEISLEHDRRHRLHLAKIAEQTGFDLTQYEKQAA